MASALLFFALLPVSAHRPQRLTAGPNPARRCRGPHRLPILWRCKKCTAAASDFSEPPQGGTWETPILSEEFSAMRVNPVLSFSAVAASALLAAPVDPVAAQSGSRYTPPPRSPQDRAAPSGSAPRAERPAPAPTALEGYSAVSIREDRRWVRGNPSHAVEDDSVPPAPRGVAGAWNGRTIP